MSAKSMFVRHVHTGEIKQVTPEQREAQDKNYWVRVTGDDVKATQPVTDAPTPDPKTTPKAASPKE
ncbi:hypothetical protein ITJ50_00915 [Curtobacterium sp. VKM Ac-2889]|uniref:hypothetical protein n=1 Tax=unclassified Curtobacterium TaxID=257496 RepID=UPI00188B6664|nr:MULTISPECIES: hypothetical protein [unclassified Curtobacterium]MBF4597177.1 hypothetical protein [Curtobacterium sp. VKM Ac-1796]MBF4609779.1 hypothetical protein [Curtobacterium sp. VKM Ac-2889]